MFGMGTGVTPPTLPPEICRLFFSTGVEKTAPHTKGKRNTDFVEGSFEPARFGSPLVHRLRDESDGPRPRSPDSLVRWLPRTAPRERDKISRTTD